MQQGAQKPRQKFCARKQRKWKKRPLNRPKRAKPGAFWVLERMGTVGNRCERMGKPGVRTKTNPIPMQHMQKENRQKPRVSAGFVAGAAETGAAERHWRSLTPRHALRRAQPCLVAKSYRTLTKKSGTAQAIPDFFGRGRRT